MSILMITTGLAACAGSSMLSSQDGFHSAQTLPRAPTNPLSTPVPRGIYSSRQTLLKRVKKSKKHSAGPPPHRPTAAGPPAPPPPRRRRHSRSWSATSPRTPQPFTLPAATAATHAAAIHAPCSHNHHARRRTSEAAAARHHHGPPLLPPDLEKERESK
jgi:hypothetical protein